MTRRTDPRPDWHPGGWLRDLHAAGAALTRLPLPAPPAAALLDPRTRRAYPLVGALVGLAAGGVFFAAHDVGLPAAVSAVLAVAALILIGGHMEPDPSGGETRAAPPFLIATLLKIAALFVIGDAATPGGGPHMAVLALVASGAVSHAAAILFEPAPEPGDEPGGSSEPGDAKVVILPPDGTAIPAKAGGDGELDMREGNGHDIGPAAAAIAVALAIAAVSLGLMGGLVAAGGAALGAFLAPRILKREIEAETLAVPVALQQSAEVWALLALAVSLGV